MKRLITSSLVALSLLWDSASSAQESCPMGSACVEQEDLKEFIQLARDQKCRQETPPTLTMQPITIVVDKEGRIYGSGHDPQPYKLKMHWCNYEIEGSGTVQVVAAQHIDREWGFRFRPKMGAGVYVLDSVTGKWTDGVNISLLVDFVYYKDLNVNVSGGLRGAGVTVGLDLTRNFGTFAGYGLSWSTWHSNPDVGLYFAF